MKKIQGLSFFSRMLVMLALLFLLLGAWTAWQTRQMMEGLFLEQQEQRGQSLAGLVAARAANLILVNNYYDLHELLRDMKETNRDVRYLYVVSRDGEVVGHTFTGGFPPDLQEANASKQRRSAAVTFLAADEGRILDIMAPIIAGRLGVVHVGLVDVSLQTALAEATRKLWLNTLLALGIGSLVAFFWARRLTRPIRELVTAAAAMTQGDMSRRAEILSDDEMGQLAGTFNTMSDHVAELLQELRRKEENRTLLLQRVIGAQEDERKRISRELHDQTGQTLTSLMMGLKCLEENCPANDCCRLDELRETIGRTLENLHRLSLELRPPILDDLGLVAATERYVQDWRNLHRIDVELHVRWDCSERLSHEVEIAVYRIVQEALTNVAKHSAATHVGVVLTCDGVRLSAIVEDDGKGFDTEAAPDPVTRRLGLFGMEERAQLVGGTLTVESSPGHGTAVYLRIPFQTREGALPCNVSAS